MFSDVIVSLRYDSKGSSPKFVMYPALVPNREAATRILKLSPPSDLLNVGAFCMGSLENSSISHSPILIISGIGQVFLLTRLGGQASTTLRVPSIFPKLTNFTLNINLIQ